MNFYVIGCTDALFFKDGSGVPDPSKTIIAEYYVAGKNLVQAYRKAMERIQVHNEANKKFGVGAMPLVNVTHSGACPITYESVDIKPGHYISYLIHGSKTQFCGLVDGVDGDTLELDERTKKRFIKSSDVLKIFETTEPEKKGVFRYFVF